MAIARGRGQARGTARVAWAHGDELRGPSPQAFLASGDRAMLSPIHRAAIAIGLAVAAIASSPVLRRLIPVAELR